MIGVQFGAGQAVKRAEIQTTGEDTVGSAALSENKNSGLLQSWS